MAVAARGDPLFDATKEFADMYARGGGLVDVVETRSSHCTAFLFDFGAWDSSIDLWLSHMQFHGPRPAAKPRLGPEIDL